MNEERGRFPLGFLYIPKAGKSLERLVAARAVTVLKYDIPIFFSRHCGKLALFPTFLYSFSLLWKFKVTTIEEVARPP